MVWPVIAAVAGIGSALYSSSTARSGAEKADERAGKAGRAARDFIREETAETLRRKAITDALEHGQGMSTIAAAGLRGSGSTGAYMDFLRTEREKTNAWTLRAGELKAVAARKGAAIDTSGLKAQSTLYALQAVQQTATAFDRGFGGPKTIPSSGGTK